ncbi:MAG TPA: AI-2E family transporter [Ilumatobacteraceae bacterium]
MPRPEPPIDERQDGPHRRTTVVDLDMRSMAAFVAALLAVLIVVAVFRGATDTITKLSVGVLIALALDPVIRSLQRRFNLSRSIAVGVVSTGLLVAFAAIAILLGPAAVREAGSVASDIPDTIESFYSWPIIGDRLEQADAAGAVTEWLDELPSRFDDEMLSTAAETVVGGIATLFVVLIGAVAVMIDGEAMVARARRLVPPARRTRADRAGRIVYQSIGRYFAGSLLVAVLNGLVITTAGLLLGVPLAPLAGIWSMLTNLIPQIGGFLGGSFFVMLAFSNSTVTGVIALAVFLLYQQLENNLIQPAIIGKAVNLLPPTTMLAALIGGAAAGVPGALAATPLLGAAKALYFAFRDDWDEPSAADEPSPRQLDALPPRT